LTEQEAKKKAMEILKPVEARLYTSEWRSLMLAIQDELVKAGTRQCTCHPHDMVYYGCRCQGEGEQQ
jgi:hypothetical protein